MGHKISGTVTQTVTLGSAQYPNPLTITSIGEVAPTAPGAIAVYAAEVGVSLINKGMILGGAGSYGLTGNGGTGGIGVDFTMGGVLRNTGTIAGGTGGGANVAIPNYAYGSGGTAVDMAGGAVNNAGLIIGGAPGGRYGESIANGNGGAGIIFNASGTLFNSGTILGAAGGYSTNEGSAGNGGIGVSMVSDSTLTNSGTIVGGKSGYLRVFDGLPGIAGIGVAMGIDNIIKNSGLIVGGTGAGYPPATGGIGLSLQTGDTLTNTGIILGGFGGYAPFYNTTPGGVAVQAIGSDIVNRGLVAGGNGAYSDQDYYTGGNGGAGMVLENTKLSNAGTIIGGTGNADGGSPGSIHDIGYVMDGVGGAGVSLDIAGLINNAGTITGGSGHGTYSYYGPMVAGGSGVVLGSTCALNNGGRIYGGTAYFPGGASGNTGGTGVQVTSFGTITNAGTIAGGEGAAPYIQVDTSAGPGGIGVDLQAGGTLTNTGTVLGGTGGSSTKYNTQAYGGNGGTGVYLNGGSLVNAGTITGGAPGQSGYGPGKQGDAVQFGPTAGTLVIDPGAVVNGAVVANAAVQDKLELAVGHRSGTLTGLGTQFAAFTLLGEVADANWVLTGANILDKASTFSDAGVLSVTGTLTDAGNAILSSSGEFLSTGQGTLQIGGVALSGGELASTATAELCVGDTPAGAAPGDITVQEGATIGGFGSLDATAVTDEGTIAAYGGVLSLAAAASGTGMVDIGLSTRGGMLWVHEDLSVADVSFAAGADSTLRIDANASVTSTLSGFALGDTIDIGKPATSLTFIGDTLTLYNGQTAIEALFLAGSYAQADFQLGNDGHGGTDITLSGDLLHSSTGPNDPLPAFWPADATGWLHAVEALGGPAGTIDHFAFWHMIV